jgi:hypothetical protein
MVPVSLLLQAETAEAKSAGLEIASSSGIALTHLTGTTYLETSGSASKALSRKSSGRSGASRRATLLPFTSAK